MRRAKYIETFLSYRTIYRTEIVNLEFVYSMNVDEKSLSPPAKRKYCSDGSCHIKVHECTKFEFAKLLWGFCKAEKEQKYFSSVYCIK